MGKMKKKGESGAATNFISRNIALKKLQLSLPDFRRLCILKGIYPREPKSRKKVNKGSTAYKTYYYVKDIQFLAHEPVMGKFREFKIFMRKLKRALGRDELSDAERLEQNKPVYTLDHIVKERYPTFVDALRDLDDSLSMVFLFATLPQTDKIKGDIVQKCKRLSFEFQHYVIASNSLKKTFISIKGIYFQAEIQGQNITWIVPHQFTQELPEDVDFRIMLTFIEFYTTMLGFINFQLYHNLNLHYPPQLNNNNAEETSVYCQEVDVNDERLAALTLSLKATVDDTTEKIEYDDFPTQDGSNDTEEQQLARQDEENEKTFRNLFKGLVFYLSREVPRDALVFLIKSFSGDVSWDDTVALGATFKENDESITHQIVDRPKITNQNINRKYVQPQWIFDCVNSKKILPIDDYVTGALLPPHLSPFVSEEQGDYMPPERKQMLEQEKSLLKKDALKDGDDEEIEDKKVKAGSKRKAVETSDKMTAEEKKLAVMMMPKKKKALYDKIMHSKKKKASQVRKLEEKRKQHDEVEIKKKKKKSN